MRIQYLIIMLVALSTSSIHAEKPVISDDVFQSHASESEKDDSRKFPHVIGVRTGVSWSRPIKPTRSEILYDPLSQNGIFGLSYGLSYFHNVSPNFHVSADFTVSNKGVEYVNDHKDYNGDLAYFKYFRDEHRVVFTHLNLPLKIGINFGTKISGFVDMGIVPSLLIHRGSVSKYSYKGKVTNETNDSHFEKGDFNKLDLGGLIEIGANIPIGKRFLFSSRLSMNWSTVEFSDESIDLGIGTFHQLAILSLGLGYKIGG